MQLKCENLLVLKSSQKKIQLQKIFMDDLLILIEFLKN